MSERIPITEEMGIHKTWYGEASNLTPETFPAFWKRLMGEYEHDYGTVCHAIAAIGIGALWAANRDEGARGGITGFQAGCIGWEVVTRWMPDCDPNEPVRLVLWKNMLYPQYEDKFQKRISEETWKWLQKRAGELLSERGGSEAVRAHWERIVAGNVPFGYRVGDA